MKTFKTPIDPSSTSIRLLSAELRCIAYLIENFQDQVGQPFDIEDIYWGLGLILTEISQALKSISMQIEEDEIKSEKQGARNSQRKKS